MLCSIVNDCVVQKRNHQRLIRLIAKSLKDLAFTCSRCQRETMDVVRVKQINKYINMYNNR